MVINVIKKMYLNRNLFLINLLSTFVIWTFADFCITKYYKSNGPSQFFESSDVEGRKNRDCYSGYFGSIFDNFHAEVNILQNGERNSTFSINSNHFSNVLFLGDSLTAGFEVNDSQTFVSVYNKLSKHSVGRNFGVRAHDTHAVIGSYLRLCKKIPHKAVVYLMCWNDFNENVDQNIYSHLTHRFGRRFNGKLLEKRTDKTHFFMAKLRSTIADKLSMTTFAFYSIKKFFYRIYHDWNYGTEKTSVFPTDFMISKTNDLVLKLDKIVRSNGAKLYVVPFPRFNVDGINIDYAKSLFNIKNESFSNAIFIDLRVELDEIFKKSNLKPDDLIIKNDGHLSVLGHEKLGQILHKKII